MALTYLKNNLENPNRSDYVEVDSKNLLTTLALDLYVNYVSQMQAATSVVYGGIVDWLYFVKKPIAIHTSMSTRDVDILTNNVNDFNLRFKYYIEKCLGFEDCVRISWRVMSAGLSISIFGFKVFDVTSCSDEMLKLAEIACTWNGIPVYVPAHPVLVAQKLQYFQSINDNFSQQRFHISDSFITKGIRGFNSYVRNDLIFDHNIFKTTKENAKFFRINSGDLANNLSKRFQCFENKNELILIGEEAVYLISQIAVTYKLITQEELDAFNLAARVDIRDNKIRLGHTDTHQLWVCADKYSKHLKIEKPKFDFTGPVTFKTIKTKSRDIDVTILASLHCGFKSVKINDNIFVPHIFTLYTIICGRYFTYKSEMAFYCLVPY